ncbi:MAG: sulfite exporter TauE/SafE family protein [Alphaproteobacteria bacterium]|nr:sulfite exporter TauE/SafE family protein [Alphaproteobacteria bacterium]
MLDLSAIDPLTLVLILAVLLVAGTVKGTVGLGLPTITLAVLTATIGLKEAMTVLLVPSFITNIWQVWQGPGSVAPLWALTRRLWLFLVLLFIGSVAAGEALTLVATDILAALLGVSIVVYAVLGLATPPWPKPGRHEGWLGPSCGLATGVLTGMTGSFVMPSVPYLQALGLPRDQLVQAMGLTFFVATVGLGAALGGRGLIPQDLAVTSTVAVVPALIGMGIGRRLRAHLSETLFRKALFAALLGVGGWIVVKSVLLANG